jgi:hypothetical protein
VKSVSRKHRHTHTHKIRYIDMPPLKGVKKLYKSIKSQALDEPLWVLRAKAATNSDTWGPTGTQLNDLSRATTFGPETFNQIFNVLFYRLDERDTRWRKCYKALIVLEFFLIKGDAHCINPIRIGRFAPKLKELQHFVYVDPLSGRDAGSSIRQRAKDIVELAEDEEVLTNKREKAKQRRDCVGISSDDTIPRTYNKGRGSVGSIEETYTAGRSSFSRKTSSSRHVGTADDWADGTNTVGSSNNNNTAGMPKSLIESPDVHQVKISKDARGRVQSIESRKVVQDQEDGQERNGYYEEDQPAGAAVAAEEGQRQKPKGAVRRRLSEPPTSEFNNSAKTGDNDVPTQQQWSNSDSSRSIGGDFFDFFDTNAVQAHQPPSGQQDMPALSPLPAANPPVAAGKNSNNGEILLAPKTTNNPFVVAQQEGITKAATATVFPVEAAPPPTTTPSATANKSLIDRTPEKRRADPNSELFDWTSAIGFDFQSLDLDTSTSPYKTLPSYHHPSGADKTFSVSPAAGAKNSQSKGAMMGPPMRSISNDHWEAFN